MACGEHPVIRKLVTILHLLNRDEIGLCQKHYLPSGASQGLVQLAPLQFFARCVIVLLLLCDYQSVFYLIYHNHLFGSIKETVDVVDIICM